MHVGFESGAFMIAFGKRGRNAVALPHNPLPNRSGAGREESQVNSSPFAYTHVETEHFCEDKRVEACATSPPWLRGNLHGEVCQVFVCINVKNLLTDDKWMINCSQWNAACPEDTAQRKAWSQAGSEQAHRWWWALTAVTAPGMRYGTAGRKDTEDHGVT